MFKKIILFTNIILNFKMKSDPSNFYKINFFSKYKDVKCKSFNFFQNDFYNS